MQKREDLIFSEVEMWYSEEKRKVEGHERVDSSEKQGEEHEKKWAD